MVGVLLVYFVIYFSSSVSQNPSFTSQPRNPSSAREGTQLILQWNYNLQGQGIGSAVISNVTDTSGAAPPVAGKTPGSNAAVTAGYEQVFSIAISDTQATLTFLALQRSDNGSKYRLQITTGGFFSLTSDVLDISVLKPAVINLDSKPSNPVVKENHNITLSWTYTLSDGVGSATFTIVASGETIAAKFGAGGKTNVELKYQQRFRAVITNMQAQLSILSAQRSDQGKYRLSVVTSTNLDTLTDVAELIVQYPARVVSLPSEYNAAAQQSKTLDCQAEGVPKPSVTWAPCDLSENVCNQSQLNIQEVIDDGVYTCSVKNDLGRDSAKTSVFIAAKDINVTLEITSESCKNGKYSQSAMLSKRLNETISKIFVNNSTYRNTAVRSVRCGSLFVDLTLTFSVIVKEQMVLSILKEAAKDGKLGEFSVDPSSIVGTRPIKPTTSPPFDKPTTSTPTVKVCHECSCNCTILIAVVCILVAIIIALIIYVVWLHRKDAGRIGRKYQDPVDEKGKNNTAVEMLDFEPHLTETRQQTFESPSQSQYMALNEASRSHDSQENPPKNIPQVSQYAPLHPSTRSWEIPRENVTIEKVIGKGAFGQVAKGTAVGLRGGSPKTQVAVKMLKDDAPESDRKDLLSELEVMKTLKPHPYVIKLLGCVTESEPLLVLIEYVPYGDLLGYLRKSRGLNDTYYKDPDVKPQTSLTSHQLMKSAWQIADGMNYLSSRSIIHRDLAARNVLVGEGETCKVTDFGMARDVQRENIYEKKTKGRLPVKWTACEALLYGTYTTKSDVWSYGVLLYEIFTIGGSPYPRTDGRIIATLLQQGYRMPQPKHVNDELYDIMTMCWQKDPNDRPTFGHLRKKLKQMENQHKSLIDMNMYDTHLYANVEDLGV